MSARARRFEGRPSPGPVGGQTAPGDSARTRLLMELQRVAGNHAVGELLGRHPPVVQRTTDEVTTHGGRFEAIGYKKSRPAALDGPEVRVGCAIMIQFTAHRFLEGTKYGLVQMVDYQDAGQPAYPAGWPDTSRRARRPGQFIDKKQRYISPLSNADNPLAVFTAEEFAAFRDGLDEAQRAIIDKNLERVDDQVRVVTSYRTEDRAVLGDAVIDRLVAHLDPATPLGDTPDRPVIGAMGRIGPDEVRPTRYVDTPSHPMPTAAYRQTGVSSSRRFETAALCVEGEMAGTYLGSVQWGYFTRHGHVRLYDFEAVSMGAPSDAFKDAARGWNETTVTFGSREVPSMQLPGNAAAAVPALPSNRQELADRLNQVRAELVLIASATAEQDVNRRKNLALEAQTLLAIVRVWAKPPAATEQATYRNGESLRAFAQRTTGDRDSWVEIMDLNRAAFGLWPRLADGQALTVPKGAS